MEIPADALACAQDSVMLLKRLIEGVGSAGGALEIVAGILRSILDRSLGLIAVLIRAASWPAI